MSADKTWWTRRGLCGEVINAPGGRKQRVDDGFQQQGQTATYRYMFEWGTTCRRNRHHLLSLRAFMLLITIGRDQER